MTNIFVVILAVIFAALPAYAAVVPTREEVLQVQANLRAMAEYDQRVRSEAIVSTGLRLHLAQLAMMAIDRWDTYQMKKIIEEFGWPIISVFGAEADHDAWLLVQHADQDVPFQKECLSLLISSHAQHETAPPNVAFLTDRVAIHNEQKQTFGTQLKLSESTGCYKPEPIEDINHVDERRAEFSLEPLSEYLIKANQFYGRKNCP